VSVSGGHLHHAVADTITIFDGEHFPEFSQTESTPGTS
jgi:hypothetical protein